MVDMKKIFSDYLRSEEEEVRFAVIKFKSCNGMKSRSFSNAECEFDVLKANENESLWVTLEEMFRNGILLITAIKNGETITDSPEKNAIERIERYYQSKETNEKYLKNVFHKKDVTETDITVVLTEHLLKALSPGQSCSVDSQSQKKRPCQCGCRKDATFGDTMIGNKSVWYGRIDVIFQSAEGDIAEGDIADNFSNLNIFGEDNEHDEEDRPAEDDLESAEEETPDGPLVEESIVEVKKTFAYRSMNQALAQTIVFSCLKRKSALKWENHMVPNIVISPQKIKIIMYDAKKDVLLYSRSISLFDSQRKLSSIAIVVLWMVLHYRLFCSGFSGVRKKAIKKCKSGFPVLVGKKWETYSTDLNYVVEPGYKKYAKIDKLLKGGRKLNLFEE